MNPNCENEVTCPCADSSPFRNLSSEAPDPLLFYSTGYVRLAPPLGTSWDALGCSQVCTSQVSQDAADLCAYFQSFDCVTGGWTSGGDSGGSPVPPAATPAGGSRFRQFANTMQSFTAFCPDGLPFTATVPAGVYPGFNQADADARALSAAQRMAEENIVCLSGPTSPACSGQPYSGGITAIGSSLAVGPQADHWQLTEGALPPGLSIPAFGGGTDAFFAGGVLNISGTPNTPGVYQFTIEITTPAGVSMQKLLTLTVAGLLASLPDADVGTAYNETLTSIGFQSPSFVLTGGVFPDGLTMDASGNITGTPTTAQSTTATVTVTDGVTGFSCAGEVDLNAVQNCNIQPDPLPDGAEGNNYLQFLTAPDFTNPVFTALDPLPPGFDMNGATGAFFAFPAAQAGTYTFRLQVDGDGGMSCIKTETLFIGPRAPMVWNLVWPAPQISIGDGGGSESHSFVPAGFTTTTDSGSNAGAFDPSAQINQVPTGGGSFLYTGPAVNAKLVLNVTNNDSGGTGTVWTIGVFRNGVQIFGTDQTAGVGPLTFFFSVTGGVNVNMVVKMNQIAQTTTFPTGPNVHVKLIAALS